MLSSFELYLSISSVASKLTTKYTTIFEPKIALVALDIIKKINKGP